MGHGGVVSQRPRMRLCVCACVVCPGRVHAVENVGQCSMFGRVRLVVQDACSDAEAMCCLAVSNGCTLGLFMPHDGGQQEGH